jgi:MFS transporter, MFS domain-containing protein family, molybdate-anion transporter
MAEAVGSFLEKRYWGSFIACSVICAGLQLYSRSKSSGSKTNSTSTNAKFQSFQTNYLIVFMLAMFADWLQGPYVYELYVSYGFSRSQIAELFVCGFASSMVVGTMIGGLADKVGRKAVCILYSISYITACCTKLVPEYWTLMVGRFLSGVSTSLLFSVFESWMVCEHHKQGFDVALLGDTFAMATFGNGLVAVIAGLVANKAAESYGYVAPFIVAILPLAVVALLVFFTWGENYGNQQMNVSSSFSKGFRLIISDSRIAALGMGQSCFEGAMYTFVFMWTPALKTIEESAAETNGTALTESTSQYLGLIFAVFMVCVMIGSSVFKMCSAKKENLYKIPLVMHFVAFLSMAVTTVFIDNKPIVYAMFLLFETTVGVFYPSYGVIKSEKIPEDIRSSVMNIFRIPLNAFVVILLLKIKFLSSKLVFTVCASSHAVAFLCYLYFYMNSKLGSSPPEVESPLMADVPKDDNI